MPHYYKLGKIPHKRHTQFRKPDGELYKEELVSTEGFSNVHSLVYHTTMPTQIKSIEEPYSVAPNIALHKNLKHRNFQGFQVQPNNDFLASRKPVLVNNDLYISLAAPRQSIKDYYYKNAQADEMIFIHQGSGVLKTIYGKIDFEYGDYLVIPRGTIYQIEFSDENNRLFIVESFSPLVYPKKYRNAFGQLMEHSPYCERDIREPKDLETHDEQGDFRILIKKQDTIYPYHYLNHPFDAVGWDGCHYPFAFSIHDFEPITGRVHQPPPVHQTFEAYNFVVCSFCPRKFDYHPEAIPTPYNHSNIDSDEILYYVAGQFMSRKHVEKGSFTLHPMGIPHGPHPGAVEKSLGAESTEELAVMVDTFNPLKLTEEALGIEDQDYYLSWVEE